MTIEDSIVGYKGVSCNKYYCYGNKENLLNYR